MVNLVQDALNDPLVTAFKHHVSSYFVDRIASLYACGTIFFLTVVANAFLLCGLALLHSFLRCRMLNVAKVVCKERGLVEAHMMRLICTCIQRCVHITFILVNDFVGVSLHRESLSRASWSVYEYCAVLAI